MRNRTTTNQLMEASRLWRNGYPSDYISAMTGLKPNTLRGLVLHHRDLFPLRHRREDYWRPIIEATMGRSSAYLAKMLGVSRSTVNEWRRRIAESADVHR